MNKWYDARWFMWLMLVFIPPIGLFLLYRNRENYDRWKIIGCVFIVWTIFWLPIPRNTHKPASDTSSITASKSAENDFSEKKCT